MCGGTLKLGLPPVPDPGPCNRAFVRRRQTGPVKLEETGPV